MTRRQADITAAIIIGAALLPFAVHADDALPYIVNPIKCDNILCLLLQIARVLLGGIAVIATFMFIYGGYVFLTSAGNADAVKKGKETLLWASLGIVVVLGSWILIQFVLKGLANTTS